MGHSGDDAVGDDAMKQHRPNWLKFLKRRMLYLSNAFLNKINLLTINGSHLYLMFDVGKLRNRARKGEKPMIHSS